MGASRGRCPAASGAGPHVDLAPVARLVVEQHRAAPAAVVGAARRDGDGFVRGWGAAGVLWPARGATSEGPAASLATAFDLASLTKPVTALTLARCQRRGLLHRLEPLTELLADAYPAIAATASAAVPLDLLTSHRAGLEAHHEYFVKQAGARQPAKPEVLAAAADRRRPECAGPPPADGFPPVYSDLGYMLAGEAIALRSNRPLDEVVAREIADPLGLALGSARLFPPGREPAPTEDVPWRGGVLRGVVHDENAWVLEGHGSAGHAGLFGDVAAVVGLGEAILDVLEGRRDGWLTAAELEPLLRRRPGGTHCAGFDRRGEAPSSGRFFGPETFGHLGFTGTSLWIDPERGLVGVVLTNRVHPTREHLAIRAARPAAYDLLWQLMPA